MAGTRFAGGRGDGGMRKTEEDGSGMWNVSGGIGGRGASKPVREGDARRTSAPDYIRTDSTEMYLRRCA